LEDHLQYYPSSLTKKAAITLVVHGLNVKPAAMLPLIKWLNGHGSDVYLIKLSGHREDAADTKNITSSIWEKEMLSGYVMAKEASIKNSVPLFFLGYSLGALLGQSMIKFSDKEVSFDKQILIAPATAIRCRSHFIKVFFIFDKQTNLPSYAPKEYRVNDSLPLSMYKILFTEEKKILKAKFHKLNIPTIIFIDPKDELISYKKLKRYLRRFSLSNYQIVVLDGDLKSRNGKYHHLIISPETMGKKNWELVTEKMKEFFSI
jgi:esterase/lipase